MQFKFTLYLKNLCFPEQPRFRISPENMTVSEGQPVMLHCVVIGDPKPEILWDKNYFRDFDYSRVKVSILVASFWL